jgi:hypothetical protein
MSENEAMTNTGPQASENDGGIGRNRLYEVPGLSHGDRLRPPGTVSTHEQQLAQRGLVVRSRADECTLERSDVPFDLLARAALANLDAWVERGEPAPRAARMQRDEQGKLVRDRFDNARGGVRVPQLDVPLARYAVPSASAPAKCRDQQGPFTNIRREPLDTRTATLEYGDREGYLRRFDAALARALADRWLLPEDAAQLRADAQRRARDAWGGE